MGVAWLAAVLWTFLPPGQEAVVPPAIEVARALQVRYDAVRDLSADFTQIYEGGVLRKQVSESGTVLIKKPGKMRWTYAQPTEKVFVSDGRAMYFYVPADRQVRISPVPDEGQATSALLFLTGKGNLTRDFVVSYAGTMVADAGLEALKLVPRSRDREYDWLILEIQRETLQIRSLVAGDQQGGTSTFHLSNIKENVGLTDNTFAFTVPPGVDIIGGENLDQ